MIIAVGVVTATPQNAPVIVGVGLVALGGLALWYRRELYLTYQWVVRYPNHGVRYVLAQFLVPVLLVVGGVALVIYPVTGW